MLFEEFISEVKESLKQYDSAGLIDDLTVYNNVIDGLNTFGILNTIRIEEIININDGKGKLPDNFKSLYSAMKCEPLVCTIDRTEPDVLDEIYYYKVRELKNEDWNFCNPCDITETESCIVEKTFLHNNIRANFYYKNLGHVKLKLTPFVKRNKCDDKCENFTIYNSEHEISINNKTLYTNFKKGKIFIIYNGYEEDEDGYVIIPDSKEGNIIKYLKALIKRKIIEDLLINSDNTTNEQFLYQMFMQEEQNFLTKAMGEIKMSKILAGVENYKKKIKREFEVYDFDKNNYTNRNRIEFIVV